MIDVCVPPEKLFDVGVIFLCIGFGVGWLVGVISAFVAIKRNPILLNKLLGI